MSLGSITLGNAIEYGVQIEPIDRTKPPRYPVAKKRVTRPKKSSKVAA